MKISSVFIEKLYPCCCRNLIPNILGTKMEDV
jgi:hypothetical protein